MLQMYPLGDTAVVVEFGEEISPAIQARVQALINYLDQNAFPGLLEWVPAYTTVTIFYDPWLLTHQGQLPPYDQVINFLQLILPNLPAAQTAAGRLIEVPVCYGGTLGPDLEWVAAHNHLSSTEVIAMHTSVTYLVYLIGFAPGFPYLGGMNAKIAAPRQATPRPQVPAGTVGIAGTQTGIYSLPSPGGWQLIGRTPLLLFDYNRQPASLLRAGDLIRFIPISLSEYESRKEYNLGN